MRKPLSITGFTLSPGPRRGLYFVTQNGKATGYSIQRSSQWCLFLKQCAPIDERSLAEVVALQLQQVKPVHAHSPSITQDLVGSPTMAAAISWNRREKSAPFLPKMVAPAAALWS